MTTEQTIPLNRLTHSKANVRRTGRTEGIAELAASIAARTSAACAGNARQPMTAANSVARQSPAARSGSGALPSCRRISRAYSPLRATSSP